LDLIAQSCGEPRKRASRKGALLAGAFGIGGTTGMRERHSNRGLNPVEPPLLSENTGAKKQRRADDLR